MTESDVQKAAIEFLLYQGWLVLRVNQGAVTQIDSKSGKRRHTKFCTWYALGLDPSSAGVNDILALAPWGELWVIECKAPGKLNQLRDSQRDFQAEARKRGAVVMTIDDPGMLIEAVEKRQLINV